MTCRSSIFGASFNYLDQRMDGWEPQYDLQSKRPFEGGPSLDQVSIYLDQLMAFNHAYSGGSSLPKIHHCNRWSSIFGSSFHLLGSVDRHVQHSCWNMFTALVFVKAE